MHRIDLTTEDMDCIDFCPRSRQNPRRKDLLISGDRRGRIGSPSPIRIEKHRCAACLPACTGWETRRRLIRRCEQAHREPYRRAVVCTGSQGTVRSKARVLDDGRCRGATWHEASGGQHPKIPDLHAASAMVRVPVAKETGSIRSNNAVEEQGTSWGRHSEWVRGGTREA